MVRVLGVVAVLCVFAVVEINAYFGDLAPGLCRYIDRCYKTVDHNVGRWSRTRKVDYACMKTTACSVYYFGWGRCSKRCGGGKRKRIGRCSSLRCDRWMREVESCNTQACETPSGTTAAPRPTLPPTIVGCDSINPCVNGVCSSVGDSFTCDCSGSGYTGIFCADDINECDGSPCVNGVCNNSPGFFSCDCTGTGFTGALCDTVVDPCNPNPCNIGSCSINGASFTCDCTGTGYDGATCQNDINECSSTPCVNGACNNSPGSFACDCTGTGFTGDLCETLVDSCNPNPCNTGSCAIDGASFTCDCTGTGYTGSNCETDVNECSLGTPCSNSGVCSNTAGSFSCNCDGTGYEGPNCDTDINECNLGSPCNTGSCSNVPGAFSCDCSGTDFSGSTCSDRNGGWTAWGSWTATSGCSASCCGGTQTQTRSRSCTNPSPAGSGVTCTGDATETQSAACNTDPCSLSCAGLPLGTILNDPCLVCSQVFYACAGTDDPTMGMCPADNVWSPNANSCEEACDV